MRWATILLGSAVLLGCGSTTRVIDTNWRSSEQIGEMLAKVRAEGSRVLLVGRDTHQSLFNLTLRGDTATLDVAERFSKRQRWETKRVVLSVPRSHIYEVRVREKKKNYVTGIRRGAAIGFLLGGELVPELVAECSSDSDKFCGLGELLLGAAGGTLFGGIAGALLAPNWKTLYRFRPDTPQQVSVVISVGPSIN